MDKQDISMRDRRVIEFNRSTYAPRVGDFVILTDGTLERFSHDWGDSLQTSPGGSWYMGNNGYIEFSGGLNPSIPKNQLTRLSNFKDGRFWFFQHDFARANNGVDFLVPCRTFQQVKP